jgi:hypothetical protein
VGKGGITLEEWYSKTDRLISANPVLSATLAYYQRSTHKAEEEPMTKQEALDLLGEYCGHIDAWDHRSWSLYGDKVLYDAIGMYGRFPSTGSTNKAMRWLGYLQGVLVAYGEFTLEDVKQHSKNRRLG